MEIETKKDPVIILEPVKNFEQVEKVSRKKTRIFYSSFRLWVDGDLLGRAHLNLMHRGKMTLNLNFEIYSRGKFPFFNKKNLETEGTINIPLPVLQDILDEAKKKGINPRKREDHKWVKRKYKEA